MLSQLPVYRGYCRAELTRIRFNHYRMREKKQDKVGCAHPDTRSARPRSNCNHANGVGSADSGADMAAKTREAGCDPWRR
jgi:hypothetical protein